ncbi:hypothetical protein [Capnocytophaga sp. oral taxon 878]|uniref:hypothetical protein n=1 Tax=Capnocytophaga sp. oral taxon 878 TaxID=1316596 RepID=UPI000D02D9AF|nr:hypothetical protein [Capnocytophaga sp. oral taxon 878]AVM49541.1 hypothetical protein C4H12_03140 [Capnocytophaga sp. oral taxon 878]
MIPIDITKANIIEAREHHYRIMRYIILKKIKGNQFKEKPPLKNMKIQYISRVSDSIKKYFEDEDNLKRVLIGLPTELDSIKSKFRKDEGIRKIFHYDNWLSYDKYNAYDLAKKLDIPTCPYCNRTYTKTVITQKGEKIIRPEFDHWFPKSEYPLLALSFYNLIPSCHICNSNVKGGKKTDLKYHFHPYNPINNFNPIFSYELKDYDSYKIKIGFRGEFDEKEKFEKSLKLFELENIYQAHEDEVKDLIKIRQAYSDKYIDMLNDSLEGVNLSKEEVYRLAFGVHYEEDKFDRRPLSKLKKDILTELGII